VLGDCEFLGLEDTTKVSDTRRVRRSTLTYGTWHLKSMLLRAVSFCRYTRYGFLKYHLAPAMTHAAPALQVQANTAKSAGLSP
jgi:hypothetical protein